MFSHITLCNSVSIAYHSLLLTSGALFYSSQHQFMHDNPSRP